jgi:glycine/D-amino acid oxidase-like deaminating enzyme
MRNGEVSFWHASLGGAGPTRPALSGPTEADVCIVGAGYTGLWTAWALGQAAPAMRVVVLDRAHVGFGASGRNGGWLSAFLPGDRERMAGRVNGRAGVVALQRSLQRAVGEVAEICEAEAIDADLCRGGSLAVATSPAQLDRQRAKLAEQRDWGIGPDDAWALSPAEVEARVGVAGALGAVFTPHCARIHPAKLVRGLAATVERQGAEIYEATPVEAIRPHLAQTVFGDVSARWVVRATEGFTAQLPGLGRMDTRPRAPALSPLLAQSSGSTRVTGLTSAVIGHRPGAQRAAAQDCRPGPATQGFPCSDALSTVKSLALVAIWYELTGISDHFSTVSAAVSGSRLGFEPLHPLGQVADDGGHFDGQLADDRQHHGGDLGQLVLGRLVRTPVHGVMEAGLHVICVHA